MAKKDLARLEDPNAWEKTKKESKLVFPQNDEKIRMESFLSRSKSLQDKLKSVINGNADYKPIDFDKLHITDGNGLSAVGFASIPVQSGK